MNITSPFKFLDAYTKEDKDVFFGREEEVEALYEMAFQSNLTLVYGQSGTGKTSLIKCGLANRFSSTNWFDTYIRRNENINDSLIHTLQQYETTRKESGTLRERLMRKRQTTKRTNTVVFEHENEVVRQLRRLYKHYLKPIYLIFDQFEEIFILGSKEEQDQFYKTIADILETETYCRIIIIMREESIAELYQFEKIVPHIFDKRLRVEPLNRLKAENVIKKTVGQYNIGLEKDELSGEIIDLLSEGTGRIELTHLQVFLDQLYKAAKPNGEEDITFTYSLIQEVGSFENILGDFLEKQKLAIQQNTEKKFQNIPQSAVSKILNAFVTLDGTKRPVNKEVLSIGNLTKQQINYVVEELEKNRLLRFDNNLFELSHDVLAKYIANTRSTEEIALLQIGRIVKDRFHAFEATKTLLNSNEIQLIKSFEQRLKEENALTEEEWIFVNKSATAVRRRRFFIGSTAFTILAALTALTIYSNSQRLIAQENVLLADTRLLEVQNAQEQQKAANYEKYLNEGKTLMATSNYSEAIQAFQTALDFDQNRQEARDSILASQNKVGVSNRFEKLLNEGDAFFNRNNDALYVDALGKYQQALALGFNNSLAQSKINATKGKLAVAFEKFNADGEAFFNAQTAFGYQMALESYRNALRIRPNDAKLLQRIREIEAKK